LIFINAVRHYLTPGLVFHFFPVADPEFWAPLFAYADLARLPEADFEIGGQRYGAYGHDWRAVPPMPWLALLAERETAMMPQAAPPRSTAPVLALSEEEFAGAVRDALRDYTRPDGLHANPLLRSRLVVEQAGASAGPPERLAALHALLKKAYESLEGSPQD